MRFSFSLPVLSVAATLLATACVPAVASPLAAVSVAARNDLLSTDVAVKGKAIAVTDVALHKRGLILDGGADVDLGSGLDVSAKICISLGLKPGCKVAPAGTTPACTTPPAPAPTTVSIFDTVTVTAYATLSIGFTKTKTETDTITTTKTIDAGVTKTSTVTDTATSTKTVYAGVTTTTATTTATATTTTTVTAGPTPTQCSGCNGDLIDLKVWISDLSVKVAAIVKLLDGTSAPKQHLIDLIAVIQASVKVLVSGCVNINASTFLGTAECDAILKIVVSIFISIATALSLYSPITLLTCITLVAQLDGALSDLVAGLGADIHGVAAAIGSLLTSADVSLFAKVGLKLLLNAVARG